MFDTPLFTMGAPSMTASDTTASKRRPGRPLKEPDPERTIEETVALLREVEARFAQTPEQHALYDGYISDYRRRTLAGEVV